MVEMSWSNISITFTAYFILLKGKKTVSINNSIIIYIIILQLSWEAEKLLQLALRNDIYQLFS